MQRTQGCNHMYCTNCCNHFCYLCEQPYATHDFEACTESMRTPQGRRVFAAGLLSEEEDTQAALSVSDDDLQHLSRAARRAILDKQVTVMKLLAAVPDKVYPQWDLSHSKAIKCPWCGVSHPAQTDNEAVGLSNHRVCRCTNHFCALCSKKIHKGKGKVAEHFTPPNSCRQHGPGGT